MNEDAHCKIGKVTLRGGAELRIYENSSPHIPSEVRRRFLLYSREIHEGMPGMAGYVIIGFTRDGGYLRAVQLGNGSHIRDEMLPSYIADILRRDWGTPSSF